MLDRLSSYFPNFSYFSYNAKRERLLKKAPDGPLKDYLSVPFPDKNIPIDQTPIMALDFETTGLSAQKDQILSIGFIRIENNEILLNSARHQIICTEGQLNEENVAIHQITDDAKAQGEALEAAIKKLLEALAGHVMLVHFARIERAFLQVACRQLYGMAPVFPIIDTLELARKRLDRESLRYPPSALRLFNLREAHHLPRYAAHNALSDALATAELFFVEVAALNYKKPPPLKTVLL